MKKSKVFFLYFREGTKSTVLFQQQVLLNFDHSICMSFVVVFQRLAIYSFNFDMDFLNKTYPVGTLLQYILAYKRTHPASHKSTIAAVWATLWLTTVLTSPTRAAGTDKGFKIAMARDMTLAGIWEVC